MFSKGDWIVYNSTGVCRVEEVGLLSENPAADRAKDYYTLQPIRRREKIYIPVDSPVYMRSVISREEAESLLERAADLLCPPCISRDLKVLHAHYRGLLQTHCCEDLMRLIQSVRIKNERLEKTGNSPKKLDQDYRHRAEELLYEELSVSLGKSYEEIADLVERALRRKIEE